MTSWHVDNLTWWQADMMTSWHDDMMTRWHDDKRTWWQADMMTSWHDDTLTWWQADMMTIWHVDNLTCWQVDMLTWWQVDKTCWQEFRITWFWAPKFETMTHILLTRVKSKDASALAGGASDLNHPQNFGSLHISKFWISWKQESPYWPTSLLEHLVMGVVEISRQEGNGMEWSDWRQV